MLNRLQGVFVSLHRHNVKYVIVGGIAAVLHGVPRATFDNVLPGPRFLRRVQGRFDSLKTCCRA